MMEDQVLVQGNFDLQEKVNSIDDEMEEWKGGYGEK